MAWDTVEIVTLPMAIAHGRLPEGEEIGDLEQKLRQAHELILDHIARDDADWTATMTAWTTATAPKVVQAAVQRQFLDLVRFRGDDDPKGLDGHALSPYVRQLLQRYHDWALA